MKLHENTAFQISIKRPIGFCQLQKRRGLTFSKHDYSYLITIQQNVAEVNTTKILPAQHKYYI